MGFGEEEEGAQTAGGGGLASKNKEKFDKTCKESSGPPVHGVDVAEAAAESESAPVRLFAGGKLGSIGGTGSTTNGIPPSSSSGAGSVGPSLAFLDRLRKARSAVMKRKAAEETDSLT